ncbi:MAG: energy-coupling factor transporter ATPase [Erysipelotrichaceae bacterium]|jgi:energy-coupling factor transport system ATP-binding protein|nr:energy-coupling factor transporter ATPase [Erysipelotrichaceae bacterium]
MPIKVNDIFYTYNLNTPFKSPAINGVTLEIKSGSFSAFIGATGSGKTTIVQELNGLLRPTSGTIEVDDFIISNKKIKNINKLRKHVGLVFQFPEYQLFEETVEKDVAFGPKNFGLKEEEALKKAHAALIAVGLDDSYFNKSPFELSGGEKRRVAIAGIIAIEPDILVLDEPTVGLDPKGAHEIMSLVDKMHKDGKTIILVTHDMNVVLKYAENVFVIKDGKLLISGTPGEVFANIDNSSGIEVPPLFAFANKLLEAGMKIDINKIKDIDSLVSYIKDYKESIK